MKYSVISLDKRYSHHQWFQYRLDFPSSMRDSQGVLHFNRCLQWLVQTYGWSAEVRQYADMHNWATKFVPMMSVKGGWVRPPPKDLPPECNPQWSWSNGSPGYSRLSIYLTTAKELAFFQLMFPIDQ